MYLFCLEDKSPSQKRNFGTKVFEASQVFFKKDVEDELEIDNDELLLDKFEIRIRINNLLLAFGTICLFICATVMTIINWYNMDRFDFQKDFGKKGFSGLTYIFSRYLKSFTVISCFR